MFIGGFFYGRKCLGDSVLVLVMKTHCAQIKTHTNWVACVLACGLCYKAKSNGWCHRCDMRGGEQTKFQGML
jgi:hypothetical protein